MDVLAKVPLWLMLASPSSGRTCDSIAAGDFWFQETAFPFCVSPSGFDVRRRTPAPLYDLWNTIFV